METRLGFGWTPLMCAVHVAHYELAELLLDHGASANFSRGKWSFSSIIEYKVSQKSLMHVSELYVARLHEILRYVCVSILTLTLSLNEHLVIFILFRYVYT